MQIKSIILYKDEENFRVLPFKLGKVNIITGESKSGKTALIDIIDYCLGSKDCKVAEGVVRENVHWFALNIIFNDLEEIFIARLNPRVKGVSTVSEIYLQQGSFSEGYPSFVEIKNNSNLDGLKELLSRKLNIAENLQVAENNTRDPLEVNFKHSRIYCYQPQTLIAQRDYLFFNQTEPFVPQAIKDSLPYFLGAIREDSLKVEQDIGRKKRDLNRILREKNEAEKIESEGVSKAFALVEEAKEVGVLDRETITETIQDALSLLDKIKDWESSPINFPATGENSLLKELLQQRNSYRVELGKIDDTISATNSFIKSNFSYSKEVEQQKIRLEHVGLFNEVKGKENECPLCNSHLEYKIPKISEINSSLQKLNKSLEQTTREKPRLNKYLEDLHQNREELKENIVKVEGGINALYKEEENVRRFRDLNLRRGKVIGRISLFLESVDFVKDDAAEKKILSLRKEIEYLLSLVDKESKEDKLASIINKINLQMSRWVSSLDVEYEDAPIRFDLPKLTLIADTPNVSIPLSRMGSGANWVNYHLLIHFALHQHFIQRNRPVPRFLIIDQPSQVYFPPEKADVQNGEIEESADEIAVKKMFDFMVDVTDSFSGSFQVIVTDHAYLRNEKFEKSVIEVWRGGNKLIPEEWL